MSTINDTTPQQEYQLFPKVADINAILSIFPSEISSEKDQNLMSLKEFVDNYQGM